MSTLKAAVLTEPALVGRKRELEELTRCFEAAAVGKGTTILISGEAGSGKTRLANEFLNVALHGKDFAALTGWCLDNVAVPYFPFIEAFKYYFATAERNTRRKEVREINAWLTGLKQSQEYGRYRNLSPQAWKDLTFTAVDKALSFISAKKITILFIEDLHWADSASLGLLHYISRSITSKKILVLTTFRREELASDAEGHPHPLVDLLHLMKREDLFKEIRLLSLNENHVSEVVENMLGGDVQPEFAARLSSESRGNPLFIVESLRMLTERGKLYLENDQWRLSTDEIGIPGKLKDIILRRLSVLKSDQRRVLEAASVIGEKFSSELLGNMLNQDTLEVLETLSMVARSTSLVLVEEGLFRFDHAKSREAVYEEIPLPLKKAYHTRIAEKLETARKTGQLQLSDIAYHYAQAGNADKSVKFAMAAGQDALARFSNTEAIKHFSYVLATSSDSSENTETRRAALEALGDAYYANCMFKEALASFELLAISEMDRTRLRAYRKAMDAVFFGQGDPTHFTELVRKAEPYAAVDRLESARIRFHKASYLSRAKMAIEWEACLRVFEEEYSLPDVARTLRALGITKALIHPDRQGLTALLRSTQISQELNDLHGVMESTQWAGVVFYTLGFFAEASEMLTKAIQIGEGIGAYNQLAASNLYLGQVQEQLGLCEEAVSTSLKALAQSEKAGKRPSNLVLACLVRQYARLGNSEAAEGYYWKLINSTPKPGPVDNVNLTGRFYLARAQTAFFVLKNRWDEAEKSLQEAFELTKRIMNVITFAKNDYAWALAKQGRTKQAREQLEESQKIAADIEKEFARLNVQASLMAPYKVVIGEEFEMRLDLVNISRKQGFPVKVEGLIPPEFKVTPPATHVSAEKGALPMEKREIAPFRVETVKLKLKASKQGIFNLNPQITYLDESGEIRTCKSNQVTITVNPAQPEYEILSGRVGTGFGELDALLCGGIPEEYAVLLASPSIDERIMLIQKYLETGARADEATFYITAETANKETMAEKHPSNFQLIVCNPQADSMIKDLPNVYKLKGVENLTELDITLTKAFRTLKPPATGPRRICIEILSDILLQHHAVATRRWLSSLIPTLKSKGFTILGSDRPNDASYGRNTSSTEPIRWRNTHVRKETPRGIKQALRVRRISNQKFIDSELVLDREKLEH